MSALAILKDPAAFNYLIMVLYVLNSGRWAIAQNWSQSLYWAAAFQITLAVTWTQWSSR